jgi:FkbM family methyltransferase
MASEAIVRDVAALSSPMLRVRSAIWQTRQIVSALAQRDPLARELLGQKTLRALRTVTPVLAVDRQGRRMFVPTADAGEIARSVFATGAYEEQLMRTAMAVITKVTGRTDPLLDRVFVDVGANIGVSTIEALLSHGARSALALEPYPEAFKLLRHNLLENDLLERVTTRCQAVTDHVGEVGFELSPVNWGDHRVREKGRPDAPASGGPSRRTLTVAATTLESAIAEAGITPDEIGCVWIDTQGHEASVLTDCKCLLAAGVPIVCEYWPFGLREAGGHASYGQWVRASIRTVVDLAEPERHLEPDAALGAADYRLAGSMRHTNFVMFPAIPA